MIDKHRDYYETDMPKIILIDFDGVIHKYLHKWKGPDVIESGPTDGAFDFILAIVAHPNLEANVYSSRSQYPEGVIAMQDWFVEHGFPRESLEQVKFPTVKPPAWVTIDDRAFMFQGKWPDLDWLVSFTPWNR